MRFFKLYSNHLKGSRKGLRPVPQTFSMIFEKFSKTAHKPLVNVCVNYRSVSYLLLNGLTISTIECFVQRTHTCIQLFQRSTVTNSTCMLVMVASLSQTCYSSVKVHSQHHSLNASMMSLISSTSSNHYPLMTFSVLPAIIMIHLRTGCLSP